MFDNIFNIYSDRLKNSLSDIDPQAISILQRLRDAGFDGYIVGGAVRDLLVNIKPKDFDIATNAQPNQIKKKVPYCFIIGRRFRLVHARRGDKLFEIATYRREAKPEELEGSNPEDLLFVEENFFGTLEEDAFRRDFTINALFYDPLAKKLIDQCGGIADIHSQTIRMIGDPTERIKEDPIRILRALRLAHKLNFSIEPTLREAILKNADLLVRSAPPRRREEWIKLFKLPNLDMLFLELFDLGILQYLLPTLHNIFLNEETRESFLSYIRQSKSLGFDPTSTDHMYCLVLYSYLLATCDHPLKLNVSEVCEQKEFQIFMKDELSVFKAEWIHIFAAFHLIYVLTRVENYIKKGERRKKALLTNENFSMALRLGALATLLSPQDISFWQSELDRLENAKDSFIESRNDPS